MSVDPTRAILLVLALGAGACSASPDPAADGDKTDAESWKRWRRDAAADVGTDGSTCSTDGSCATDSGTTTDAGGTDSGSADLDAGSDTGSTTDASPPTGTLRPAASCSYTDVSTAVASASVGDTVTVPAGSCTWNSTLTVDKGIRLIGAGKASTVITNGAGTVVSIMKTQSDFVRLSGFRFESSDSQTPVVAVTGPAYKVRIDNIVFNKGDAAVGTNWMGGGGLRCRGP